MITELSTVSGSAFELIARPWWTIWAGMHWGFRKSACVLWCCTGRVHPQIARHALGIDTFSPVDVVVFYRELVCELTPEKELAQMIVDLMPVAERKHLKRFYAGKQVFEAGEGRRTIAQLINEVFRVNSLPSLRESDDSEKSHVADGRNFSEGLRRTIVMRSDDPPIEPNKTPLLFIAGACPQLIETIPALEADLLKRPEDIKPVGNEQDSIWEAAKTCFREYPSISASLPFHVRRQQAIERGVTDQQRYLNMIDFDHKNKVSARRPRRH